MKNISNKEFNISENTISLVTGDMVNVPRTTLIE